MLDEPRELKLVVDARLSAGQLKRRGVLSSHAIIPKTPTGEMFDVVHVDPSAQPWVGYRSSLSEA
jgi:hypothetical protein